MKKLLLILLFIPIVFGLNCSQLQPSAIGSAAINYSSSGGFVFDFPDDRVSVEYVEADIRVIPQTSMTGVSFVGNLSNDEFSNSIIHYKRTGITQSSSPTVWFLRGVAHTSRGAVLSDTNPSFPYTDPLPANVSKYLAFTSVADNSYEIQSKVSELLAGVTDYLTAVSILSRFVAYYLQYDRAYSRSSIPSSQVYSQHSGVCDEFSSLLISMLRNAGIPARFVSGFAYTNLGLASCSNFEPHSWVEFYVPGTGWLSVDPTYREFFWINAGHLPLYSSTDASTNIINASYRSSSVETAVVVEQPSFAISLLNYSSNSQGPDFFASFSNNAEVGESDYILITITVSNPYNAWLLDTLFIETTNELQIVYNNKSIPVIVAPDSVSEYNLILLTPGGLQSGYIYTHPFLIRLGSGAYELYNITVNPSINIQTSYSEYYNLIETISRTYYPSVSILNSAVTPGVVTDESPVLSFDIKNTGNSVLNDVMVSISYENIVINESVGGLLLGEEKSYSKLLQLPNSTGRIDVNVLVSSGNVSSSIVKTFSIVSNAPFDFSLSGPSEYDGSTDYTLNMVFSSVPSDFSTALLKIYVNNDLVLNQNFYFSASTIQLAPENFDSENNAIRVSIEYSNLEGDRFIASADKTVAKVARKRSIIEELVFFFNAIIDVFKILLGLN